MIKTDYFISEFLKRIICKKPYQIKKLKILNLSKNKSLGNKVPKIEN